MSSKDARLLGQNPPSPQRLSCEEKSHTTAHTRRSYSPPRHEPSPSHPKRHTSPRLILAGIIVALAVFLTGLHYIDAASPITSKMTSILPGATAQELHDHRPRSEVLDARSLTEAEDERTGVAAHELQPRNEPEHILETRDQTEEELDNAVDAILAEERNPPTTRMGKQFPDLTLISTLPKSYIPVPSSPSQKDVDSNIVHKKRLIVVGDVHGMLSELQDLLRKLEFDSKNDHLVAAGDMISKGPDSVGVIKLLMSLNASAVRGNHEDRVLLAHKGMRRKALRLVPESLQRPIHDSDPEEEDMSDRDLESDPDEELSDMEAFTRSKEYKDRLLAKKFSKSQISWLASRPVILKVGQVDGLGTVAVVHGGIVPGVKLERQDPYAVMNMRTIDLKTRVPSEGHAGVGWTKLFNRWQARVVERSGDDSKKMTVIYGHDSRRGLQINDYTKGLDSGCLKGGRLTAFVMEGGNKRVETSLVSVRCRDKK